MTKRVIITGASSGIGQALAHELASRGCALGLTARRVDRLEQIQADIRRAQPGAHVEVHGHDVTQSGSSLSVFETLRGQLGGFDVLVANAGIGGSGAVGTGKFDKARAVIEVNLVGAMETIDAAASLMRQSGGGHIVGMSSVMASRGMAGSAAYSASKAGLSAYLEAARAELVGHDIAVTVVSPGYIDTPLNHKVKKRPFVITASEGARKIADVIERQPLQATVPRWPWSAVAFVMRNAPDRLWLRMTGRR